MEDGNTLELWKLVVMIVALIATNVTAVVISWINVHVRLKAIEVDHDNTKGRVKRLSERTDERFEKWSNKVDKLCGEIHSLVVQLAEHEGKSRQREGK